MHTVRTFILAVPFVTTFALASPLSIGTISAGCAYGGGQVTTGTYDSVNGAVDFTIKLTECAASSANERRGGTVVITGVARTDPSNPGSLEFAKLTSVFNTTELTNGSAPPFQTILPIVNGPGSGPVPITPPLIGHPSSTVSSVTY